LKHLLCPQLLLHCAAASINTTLPSLSGCSSSGSSSISFRRQVQLLLRPICLLQLQPSKEEVPAPGVVL
jgi:hypothetical protein